MEKIIPIQTSTSIFSILHSPAGVTLIITIEFNCIFADISEYLLKSVR
jgi:hypothetical protein